MKKSYSDISKQIINYIFGDGDFSKLSNKQKEVIKNALPNAIKGLDRNALFKNNVITGKNNLKYKINYNKKSNWLSFSGSQVQCKTIFKDIKREFDESISTRDNLLKWIKEDLKVYISYMLNAAQQDGEWIIFTKKIDGFTQYSFKNFEFEFETIESDIKTNNNKNTWYIKWNGKKMFQIQVPISKNRPNSHNFRINMNLLDEFYNEVKINNETWGISVEVALCKLNSIPVPQEYTNRHNKTMVLEAEATISEYFMQDENKMPSLTKCLATIRNGTKKSSTDFMAGEYKVSVKSNFNGNTKVCPPEIGQPGIINGLKYYSDITKTEFTESNIFNDSSLIFKQKFQKNIDKIFKDQVKMLFSEDYIFYIRKLKNGIITMQYIETKIKKYNFDISKFTFTLSPSEWNESVSIGYDGQKSVAEMQLHKNRSPFKFRFNLMNLMSVIKKIKEN